MKEFINIAYLFVKLVTPNNEYTTKNFLKLTSDILETYEYEWGQIFTLDTYSNNGYLLGDGCGIAIITDGDSASDSMEIPIEEGTYFTFQKKNITIDDVEHESLIYPFNLVKQITQPVYHTIPHKFLPHYYKM
jgi:hypothetical protein